MDSIGNHSTEKTNFARSGTGMLHPPLARSQDPAFSSRVLWLFSTFIMRENAAIHPENR
jgi:hypothetical protein